MASIADLFLKVIAEMTGFEADVVKGAKEAGAKGGKELQNGLASGLKTAAVKGFGVAAAGAFALASKGALELSEIQRTYQAETGASADEAKAAAETINRVAGSQQQSLQAVSDAAVRVRRDLGLVGPEADKMTETIVRFARVTRQDAGDAVSQLDDILDSWGLTAGDADEVLNKLLVSNHKFGGEISETSKTLAALAPSMRAANLELDDGVALLGLFGAKGLDAGQASAAFSKALTKVKSPKELQDLITDISNTEDPFKRAQKAADLFGAKAGAKLANALGGAHLDDYKISMEEAAGATETAADALDSGFGGQLKKKISELGAAIRGLGSDFGPGVTGAASLISLLGTLGGGKLIGKLQSLGDAGIGIGKRLGIKIAAGLAGSSVITAMSASLAGVFSAVGDSSVVKGASDKIGTTLGGRFGLAFKIAAVAGIAAIAAEVAGPLQDIGKQIHEAILGKGSNPLSDFGKAWQDWRKNTPWPLGQKDAPDWASLGGEVDDGLDTALVEPFDRAADNASLAAAKLVPAVADGITSAKPLLAGVMKDLIPPFGSDLAAKGKTAGAVLARSVADGVKSARAVVSDAMSILRDALDHEMSPAKERATLLGELAGKELAHGLKSKDPVVRQAAEDAKEAILERLEQLVPANGKLGKKSASELAKALKSKDPEVRAAAAKIKATIEKKLDETKAKKAGSKKGQEVADGVRSKKGAVGAAALALAKKVAQTVIATIKSYGSGGGSRSQARAMGGPVVAGTPYLVNENTPRSETFVPSSSGYILTRQDAMAAVAAGGNSGPGGVTVNLSTYGLPMYAPTPVEVGRQVRRHIKAGTPLPPARRATWEKT